MHRSVSIRSLAFAVATILLAVPSYADDDDESPSLDDTPHVTMVGTAHVEARPDLATITIGVTTEKPSAKAAADEIASRAKVVIDAAKADGVAAADIVTRTLTLYQTFEPTKDEYGRQNGRKPRGFAAQNIFSIRLRALDKVGAITEDLLGHGATDG